MSAPTIRLSESHQRLLNVLYNRSDRGTLIAHYRPVMLAADTNRATLIELVDADLATVRRCRDLSTLNLSVTPEDVVVTSVLKLTARGAAWVEDDPRNALLRRVDASPLGRVTLRHAINIIPFGSDIRDLITEGYVSLHCAADRMEVPARLVGRAIRNHLDDYILLPTPKIRRVLGARS